MNRPLLIIVLATLLSAPYHSSGAAAIRTFHNINQLPFKQIFGLPSLDNSPLTEAGRWRVNLVANISNSYSNAISANEQLATDYETFRSSLIINYGLRDNLQLSFEVPYISHNGGFLDDFIYDWHDFFNSSQNGRIKEDSNRLYIAYLSGGSTPFKLTDSQKALETFVLMGPIPGRGRTEHLSSVVS